MTVEIKRRGLMFVLSSPSGAGKSTLSRGLLKSEPNLTMSVSATTRSPRPGETHGREYYFVGLGEFQRMVQDKEFLEHAEVFGNHYGTPKEPVMEALASGQDVLFDIDWQGAQQLRALAGDDMVSVFILPPSRAELERRLRGRAEDTPEVIAQRMAKASNEISRWSEYDYVVVNDDVAVAQTQVTAILAAERLKRTRQPGLLSFVDGLVKGG
ncbi:guanylate kinase [Rhizomicrobium palustre]|uniref:Guanylate kinase n=1 Tax=Rhizomicrobium palustre TaxID=189966 RepID=A0A846MU49_9PROT|nr:guanylate kinase [Rhizomicrobium palustre]NIK87028.1 guanylate kinase [Rhizomicrobium palustre]